MKHSEKHVISRRNLIAGLAGAGSVFCFGGCFSGKSFDSHGQAGRRRVLRFAHFTDIHLCPERRSSEGFAAALRHVQSTYKPDLIITGGDNIMESFQADDQRTSLQWELFKQVLSRECSVPVKYCIGNHDVWGGNRKESGTTGTEPLWGKARAVHEMSMPGRYYSFKKNGWRFLVIDAIQVTEERPPGYIGLVDDEQMDWLKSELSSDSDTPSIVVSHIPILTATNYERRKCADYKILEDAVSVCYNGPEIVGLFKKYPCVKLCLSGHIHRVDRVEYRGVTYICDGAVSGAWWNGDHDGFAEGYGLIDLYDDNTFDHQYVSYNWIGEKEMPVQ